MKINNLMTAIYFLEIDKVKFYKCDTFWSRSEKINNAKLHDDSKYDQDRFWNSLTCIMDIGKEEIPIGALYGYQLIRGIASEEKRREMTVYLRRIDEELKSQWKDKFNLDNFKTWKELFSFIKNLGLRYRVSMGIVFSEFKTSKSLVGYINHQSYLYV